MVMVAIVLRQAPHSVGLGWSILAQAMSNAQARRRGGGRRAREQEQEEGRGTRRGAIHNDTTHRMRETQKATLLSKSHFHR